MTMPSRRAAAVLLPGAPLVRRAAAAAAAVFRIGHRKNGPLPLLRGRRGPEDAPGPAASP